MTDMKCIDRTRTEKSRDPGSYWAQPSMGAMLGTVLSGNLIQLVIFWELTSLTSFMLIAYW